MFDFKELELWEAPKDLTKEPGLKEIYKDRESIISHGIYDVDKAAILPISKKLRGVEVFPPKVQINYKEKSLYKALK